MSPRFRPRFSERISRAWQTAPLLPFALMLLSPAPASAQGYSPHDASAALSSALLRLGQDPRDAEALITAGNAALAMGDTDAAVSFFTRADRLMPDNSRIEAGLAGAKVRGEDPFAAIPLFDAAAKHGTVPPELLGDRGLAYDLVGDNVDAQRYYNQALALGPNDEISRRLALSLAIGGDRLASERVLAGLLQKQDRAAWRTRIFALAILGHEDEAVATARATMPPDMALGVAPYLRYMRQLTPAQQAAAANLGHFPLAAQIGHDDPRIAQYAASAPPVHAGADLGLIPAGAPLGRAASRTAVADDTASAGLADRHRRDRRKDRAALAAAGASSAPLAQPTGSAQRPPELTASRETEQARPSLLADAVPPPRLRPVAAPIAAAPPPVVAATVPDPVAAPPRVRTESLAVVEVPHRAPVFAAPAPHPAAAIPPEPAPRPSFSEAFGDLAPARIDTAPARGAVDLRKITPARAIPKPPPPPSHPSQIWVELGVGRDTDRLAFDWRRMVKDDPELFKGKKPSVTGWARTNRLLVGPFETEKAANTFTDKLHKGDETSAFVWTSPAGQVVDPLDDD